MSANNASSTNRQSSNTEDELVFRGVSSSSKRKNSDYFIKPEDIERRKRQEERESENRQRKLRREASKKQEAKVDTTIDSKTAAKNVARSEKRQLRKLAREQSRVRFAGSVGSARRKLAAVAKVIFSGKKLFIYLIILGLVALVAFNSVFYRKVILPGQESVADADYEEYMSKYYMAEISIDNTRSEMEMEGDSVDKILDYLNNERKKYSGDDVMVFLISLQYGGALCDKDGYDKCIDYLKSIEKDAKYEYEKEKLYYQLYRYYSRKQDFSNGDIYASKLNSLKRRVVKENVKDSKTYYEGSR